MPGVPQARPLHDLCKFVSIIEKAMLSPVTPSDMLPKTQTAIPITL